MVNNAAQSTIAYNQNAIQFFDQQFQVRIYKIKCYTNAYFTHISKTQIRIDYHTDPNQPKLLILLNIRHKLTFQMVILHNSQKLSSK